MEILIRNEVKRKAIHLFALSIPIGYCFVPQYYALLILVPISLFSLAIDLFRILELPGHRFFIYIFGPMLRDHEEADLTGGSYILFASTVCIAIFSKPVALAAMGFIILGDISSALIGRNLGKISLGNKTLEGSLGFFISCLLVIVIIPEFNLIIGLLGAFLATALEAIDTPIDDNLLVPVISGLVMQTLLEIS
ncbi:MAG: dolichol kinase [candidate division Zixibacteria bacterium]|nr:dolichol kinase [candidate division Zixibacteria bacterium]